jgi:glycosyltransferase involved in cell wall biosynthesis
MKLLSIVIPAWNREKEVIRLLDSIRPIYMNCQSDVEIIVTDNCSDDATVETVKNWSLKNNVDLLLLVAEKNVGPVRNWIKGVEHSTSKYTHLLFSDDYINCINTDFIKDLKNNLDESIGLYSLPVRMVDQDLNVSNDVFLQVNNDSLGFQSKSSFVINHLLPSKFFGLKIKRTFSPVSPSGYFILSKVLQDTLKKYVDHHTFTKNGAGIDHMTILSAALKGTKVGCLTSPISYMVASPTSITRLSQKSSIGAIRLANSYNLAVFYLLPLIITKLNFKSFFIVLITFARLCVHNSKLISERLRL